MRRALWPFALSVIFTVPIQAAADPLGIQPGHRFEVRSADLPAPYTTPSTPNGPRQIDLPRGAGLIVPDGFRATVFADGLQHARWLTVADDGTVFLAESGPGQVTLLRDLDGDGVAEVREPYVSGLVFPHGLAVRGGFLYVADVHAVRRYPYSLMLNKPTGPEELVTAPGVFGGTEGHRTRGVIFDPSDNRFFVTVGSAGNIGVESTADSGGGRELHAARRGGPAASPRGAVQLPSDGMAQGAA